MCDYGNGLGWEGGAGLQYDKLRRGCSGPMVGRPFHHTHTHTHALLVPGWKGGLATWFPVRGIRACSVMAYTGSQPLAV